jgi:GrpB-like predicted nucleotidyltransferase (UPF0157 family)
MKKRPVVVVDYDPAWPEMFEQLAAPVRAALGDLALRIEHVGSTSVRGLAAKPIVDISVVVGSESDVGAAIERLASVGYVHQGDLGIEGREAFAAPEGLPAHNLYVCDEDSLGLVNQLAFRNYLRQHAETATAYAALKKSLAARFPNDIDGYVDGKTDFVLEVLRASGFSPERLAAIARANGRAVS